jgi:RNA polymerase sigma factor (sigma-70 family)
LESFARFDLESRPIVMTDKRYRFEQEALPHLGAAYNLARWLSRSTADAEDIVQEALLLAFRSFDDRRGASAKPWLLAIVRNCYLSAARRMVPRERVTDPLDDDDAAITPSALVSSDNPERTSIEAEQARTLDAVLRLLPPDHREVLILRELEELSYREIATATGVRIGTVMSRLARARAALKSHWLRTVGETDDVLS